MKKVLLVAALAAMSMNTQAFDINVISAWGKKSVKALEYKIPASGSDLRGYTWCDPAMKKFIFYGASSKTGEFHISRVDCTPTK